MRLPSLTTGSSAGVPVITNSMPCPTDGPYTPIGEPTPYCQSVSPISLPSAIITPEGLIGVLVGAPNTLYSYGLPVAVMCPEKTSPLVTTGETQVGNSVLCCHLILPASRSTAVMVPLPMLFGIASNIGSTCPIYGLTGAKKELNPMLLVAKYAVFPSAA